MRPHSYVTPEMTANLASYEVEELSRPGWQARCFLLRPKTWDGKSKYLFLTFTPGGIALQGPLLCGLRGRGVLSDPGKSFAWFMSDLAETDLLPTFLDVTWQFEVAERDLRDLAASVPEKASFYLHLADRLRDECEPDEKGLLRILIEQGCPDFDQVGYDYPLTDAGWLCAAQRRFVEAMRQVN